MYFKYFLKLLILVIISVICGSKKKTNIAFESSESDLQVILSLFRQKSEIFSIVHHLNLKNLPINIIKKCLKR